MAGPDDFTEHLRQRVLGAFGFESQAELDAATEEALPGYLAAEAEYGAEVAAYTAALPDRVAQAQQTVTEFLRDQGMLPDGVELELAPMDLQADAQWMAQAPWAQPATPAEPSDVLARIDAAIDDWEDGPDAARWHPDMPETDEVPAPPFAGILVTLDGEYVRPPRCRCSVVPARLEISATSVESELDTVPAWAAATAPISMASEFQRQTALLVEGQLLAGALETAGLLDGFMATVRNACESVVALSRALRLEPRPHGWHAAAQDYRRRTKHRNRRRKS